MVCNRRTIVRFRRIRQCSATFSREILNDEVRTEISQFTWVGVCPHLLYFHETFKPNEQASKMLHIKYGRLSANIQTFVDLSNEVIYFLFFLSTTDPPKGAAFWAEETHF